MVKPPKILNKIKDSFIMLKDRISVSSNQLFLTEHNPLKDGYYITPKETFYFRANSIIGKGSFGVVYSAQNKNGERIAVKTKKTLEDHNLNSIANNLFQGELDTLCRLQHPNIVNFIGIEYFYQEPVSLVMEHIDGENLDVLVKRKGRLDENFIKAYSVQILDAIIYMHSCNIIHRDIKSSNIMVIKEFSIKIIDFGMAKHVKDAYSPQSDCSSTVVGTLPYMAPELTKFKKYDARVDVWSLGVVIYEMGNGEPFHRVNGKAMNLSQLSFRVSLSHLSPAINNFIQICLIKEYKMRPRAFTLVYHPFHFS